jgi:hypothetical protein
MKIKDIIKGLGEGFYYLGRGFSMITMFPYMDYRLLNDKEAFNEDVHALMGDWRVVSSGLEKTMEGIKK